MILDQLWSYCQWISNLFNHSYSCASCAEAFTTSPPHQLLWLLKSIVHLMLGSVIFVSLWYLSHHASPLCWWLWCWCHSTSCKEYGKGLRAVIPNYLGWSVNPPLATLYRAVQGPTCSLKSSHCIAASGGVRLWCRCNLANVNWFPIKLQHVWCLCW